MSNLTIFFGDVTNATASNALQFDDSAILLDYKNYQDFLDNKLSNCTFYTSLGDLPKNYSLLYRILGKADDIYYCANSVWSDGKDIDHTDITKSIKGQTEFILSTFAHIKNNVHNLDLSSHVKHSFIKLNDQRKSNQLQLWVAGGSDTHGVGVLDHERYGKLLAKMLNVEVSFLTWPCASIKWSADQIIRSDIRPGDFVVLGLVPDRRYPFWSELDNNTLHVNITFTDPKYKNLDLTKSTIEKFLTSNHLMYENIVSIHQVINFCRKVKAKLLILGLNCSDELTLQLYDIPEFKKYVNINNNNYHNDLIDVGSDNVHPGPLQHQLYADFCQAALKKLSYI